LKVFLLLVKALLDHNPKILNWIKIWTLSKPRKPLFAWNAAATFDLWGAALSAITMWKHTVHCRYSISAQYLYMCISSNWAMEWHNWPHTLPWNATPMHMTRTVFHSGWNTRGRPFFFRFLPYWTCTALLKIGWRLIHLTTNLCPIPLGPASMLQAPFKMGCLVLSLFPLWFV